MLPLFHFQFSKARETEAILPLHTTISLYNSDAKQTSAS